MILRGPDGKIVHVSEDEAAWSECVREIIAVIGDMARKRKLFLGWRVRFGPEATAFSNRFIYDLRSARLYARRLRQTVQHPVKIYAVYRKPKEKPAAHQEQSTAMSDMKDHLARIEAERQERRETRRLDAQPRKPSPEFVYAKWRFDLWIALGDMTTEQIDNLVRAKIIRAGATAGEVRAALVKEHR